MYMSTALIIGVFFLGMFLVRPANTALWRCLVMVAAVPAIFGTLPYRKGIAIAIEYLVDLTMTGERSVELRRDEAPDDAGGGLRDD